MWGWRTDAIAFGAPLIVSLGLAVFAPALRLPAPAEDGGNMPSWAWLAFVVGVDVAHVHTTLFRTYFDRDELRRRPWLYGFAPAGAFAIGALLHHVSALAFWRALAYLAVFHFVRQQAGWMAILRRRAGEVDRLGRFLDDAAIYAATLFPLLHWHAHAPRAFRWLIEDDFVPWHALQPWIPGLAALYGAILIAYAAREIALGVRRGFTSWGKHLVLGSTAITWLVGIVIVNDDFTFTVTNVLGHGVPYFVLLWRYTRARGAERRAPAWIARVAAAGVPAFLGVVVAIALLEEACWDRLVWHDRSWLFGGARAAPLLSPAWRAWIVPLLSVPQATHYVLDALLWRRKDTGPAQARALGFS